MLFWFIIGGLTLALCAFILQPLFLADLQAPISADDSDLRLYKAQLSQLERDLAQGQIDETAAQDLRIEISRRILALDARESPRPQPMQRKARLFWLLTSASAMIFGAVLLYMHLGHIGLPDYPLAQRRADMLAQRPSQTQAESRRASRQDNTQSPDLAPLIKQLRLSVENRPNDTKGLRLLANSEASIGNFIAAHRAQERLIGALGNAASADDYAQLAEYLIFAADGIITTHSENALNAALHLAPNNLRARYYSGLAQAQIGRPNLAYGIWTKLLNDAPPNSPWRDLIAIDLPAIAAAAGIKRPITP